MRTVALAGLLLLAWAAAATQAALAPALDLVLVPAVLAGALCGVAGGAAVGLWGGLLAGPDPLQAGVAHALAGAVAGLLREDRALARLPGVLVAAGALAALPLALEAVVVRAWGLPLAGDPVSSLLDLARNAGVLAPVLLLAPRD